METVVLWSALPSRPQHFRAYLWLLYGILAVYAVVLLLDLLHFLRKRLWFYLRLRKSGAEYRGLHPLWMLLSLPGRADFLLRDKSGALYAVRFVENWRRGTEFAVPSANRWYFTRHYIFPRMHFHIGFRAKLFSMDFRPALQREKIKATPLWLVYPRPYRISTAPHDPGGRLNVAPPELSNGSEVEGIRFIDGHSLLARLGE